MDWLDWLLVIARVLVVFAVLLVTVMIAVWMERKVVADMQTRMGPMRAGPRGVLQSLADGVKLFFKEGVRPLDADRWVYLAAPVMALIPAFLAFAVVPFGEAAEIAGRTVPFQLANLDVGILWVLSMSSLAVYGIVLAGWSSGSRYPLLGAVRSSAQMISYEVGMGLAIVAVVMYAGTLNLNGIVDAQDKVWNIIPQFPAFIIYIITALAETNRPPFDLAEAESELVAGFFTEYSGIKFSIFALSEYLHTVTVASIAVTLFLGGWRGPMFDFLPWVWPVVWFILKVFAVLYLFMWIRATLPRFRYDRLMAFGWKVLIPIGLFWVLATATVIVLPAEIGRRTLFIWMAGIAAVVLLVSLIWPQRKPRQEVSA
jgi:NADH-quinone oxidoreductase subunit H